MGGKIENRKKIELFMRETEKNKKKRMDTDARSSKPVRNGKSFGDKSERRVLKESKSLKASKPLKASKELKESKESKGSRGSKESERYRGYQSDKPS